MKRISKLEAQAKEQHELIKLGEKIADESAVKAIEAMLKITSKANTKSRRLKIIQDHALHMGIGTQFMNRVAPLAEEIREGLIEINEDETDDAKILTGLFLAEVFQNIEKELNKHGK